MTYVCQLFPSPLFDLILQICLLDLLWIRPLISLHVYCGLLLVGNAIKCYLNLLAVCFVRALLSSYLFFRFRSAMPPRHSKRTHATSSEAITVAAATEPTRQKSRDSSRPALATNVEQWTDQQPSSSHLPPDLMDQLVSWIVKEVTQRLSPPEVSHSGSSLPPGISDAAPFSSHGPSLALATPSTSSLLEVPVGAPTDAPVLNAVSSEGLVATIVQGPLDAAQPSLSGEMHPINPAVPSQLFSSPSPPIDSRVSDKLKAKIWNNEYFELRALLTYTVHESRYQVTLARTTAEQLPSLYLEPIVKPRKIVTIETWLSCFHIFIAIYTRRHPHEAPPLMKYCGVIQDLAASGFNWCFYDENFCLLNQAQPSSFRWCNIHWELWMRAQHSTASKPQTLPGCLRSHEQGIPKGFCVKFHRGVQCVPGCAFKHLCYKFEGPQKASQCNFRSQSKNTGKQSFLPSPNPQSLTLPTPINAERLVFLLSGRF